MKNIFSIKSLALICATALIAFSVGCTTTEVSETGGEQAGEATGEQPEGATGEGEAAAEPQVAGEVSLVDNDFNYVILKSTGKIKPDSELEIYRGKKKVGVVKVSAPRRDNFISADIVEGKIRVGDIAKQK